MLQTLSGICIIASYATMCYFLINIIDIWGHVLHLLNSIIHQLFTCRYVCDTCPHTILQYVDNSSRSRENLIIVPLVRARIPLRERLRPVSIFEARILSDLRTQQPPISLVRASFPIFVSRLNGTNSFTMRARVRAPPEKSEKKEINGRAVRNAKQNETKVGGGGVGYLHTRARRWLIRVFIKITSRRCRRLSFGTWRGSFRFCVDDGGQFCGRKICPHVCDLQPCELRGFY